MKNTAASFLFLLAGLLVLSIFILQPAHSQTFDLGGRTIRIENPLDQTTPFSPLDEPTWGEPDARLKAHIEEVEEKFNCEIEIFWGAWGDERTEEIASNVLAGEPHADVYRTLPHNQVPWASLAMDGILLPLDDVIDLEEWRNSLPFMHQPQAFGREIQGQVYTFTGELQPITEQIMIAFNHEIFDREGLPSPYELVDEGNWTWETFREIAEQAARDTTGDGEIDQYGAGAWQIGGDWHPTEVGIVDWAIANSGSLAREDDGREVVSFHEPEFIDAIDFWKGLFEDNVASQEYWGPEGNVAMTVTAPHTLDYDFWEDDVEVGLVPLPKGPEAEGFVFPRGIGHGADAAMPVTEEEPRAVLEVVDALWQLTDTYRDIEEYEQQFFSHLEMLVHDRESMDTLEMALEQPDPWNFHYQYIYTNEDYTEAILEAITPEASTTTVLSGSQPAVQSFVDDLFDQ